MKFITYIKAIETKLDLANEDNKIELGDVLYMMRNAKKFGLNIEDDDSDLTYKIKSAIHESEYKDVVMRIVDNVEELVEETQQQANVILTNTYLENETIVEEKAKKKTPEVFKRMVAKEDTRLAEYISKFGELDFYERKNKEEFKFKDRCVKFFDEKITDYQSYNIDEFKTKNFFHSEELYLYFFTQLFNKETAMYNNFPHVFIGNLALSHKEPIRYVTVDIFYFLAFIYMIIKRENRESFFKFIFSGKNLNTNNVNMFLKNIDDAHEIFYPDKEKYLFDAIYTFGTTTIKTSIFRMRIRGIEKLLREHEPFMVNYSETKKTILGIIKTKAFGIKAKKTNADNVYSHDTFFRKPI